MSDSRSTDQGVRQLHAASRRMFWTGVSVTAAYLILGSIWLGNRLCALATKELSDLGNFLAGALAPVAFLWIILTFRLQQLELRQNTEELRLQAKELRHQVEATRDLVDLDRARFEADQARSEARFIVGHRPTKISDGRITVHFENRGGDAAEINFGGPNVLPERVPFLGSRSAIGVTMPSAQGQQSTADFVYSNSSGQWKNSILVNPDGEVRLVGKTRIS